MSKNILLVFIPVLLVVSVAGALFMNSRNNQTESEKETKVETRNQDSNSTQANILRNIWKMIKII